MKEKGDLPCVDRQVQGNVSDLSLGPLKQRDKWCCCKFVILVASIADWHNSGIQTNSFKRPIPRVWGGGGVCEKKPPNRFAFYSVKATCIKTTGCKSKFNLLWGKKSFAVRGFDLQTFRSRDHCCTNTPRKRGCDQWCIDGILYVMNIH